MTRRNLEIFVAAAECQNMSEAGRRLFVTQSSVSQVISDIERENNVVLFERLSRGLYLTETGRELLRYAKRMLALDAEMREFLNAASKTQKLRLGATVTVGTCVISPILLRLKAEIPSLRAETLVANTHILEEKLLRSELDICLVEGRISHPELIVERVIPDKLVMICSRANAFSGRDGITLGELSRCPFILREPGSGTRAQIESEFAARSLPLHIAWDCYNTEAILNAVADDHGVSIISELLVEEAFRSGKLWMCPVTDADLSRSFSLVYHKDKYISSALDAFRRVCAEYGAQGNWHISENLLIT